MKFAPIFMKFGSHNKSNMLIMILIHTSVESAGVIDTKWLFAQNDYRLQNLTHSRTWSLIDLISR